MGASGSSALARLGLPGRPRSTWLGVAALGLAAVALGTVAWRRARPGRRRRLRQVGTVSKLWIYPIKSCKGVAVSEAECTAMGLRRGHLRDRFWLVINEEGNMVTARQEPRMVLISLTCEDDTLTLSAAYTKDLLLPIRPPATNALRQCRVHSLEVQGRDCGEAAAEWISSFLQTQQPYRLVYFEPHMRPRNSQQMRAPFRPTDQVAYSDASPFLILSEASLADLNSRMETKVKASNFRPNIVISGCGVYEEVTLLRKMSIFIMVIGWEAGECSGYKLDGTSPNTSRALHLSLGCLHCDWTLGMKSADAGFQCPRVILAANLPLQ